MKELAMPYSHKMLRFAPAFLAAVSLLAWALPLRAAEEGVHASLISDEDDDDAILMESEWMSMHLLPWRQALIDRFVFRPSGKDIVEPLNAKVRMAGGGGILMDCLWEQDWRFQELAFKSYRYTITKNGPDEAQVVFSTDIVGWLGANNSGVISKLLSNLTLKRTVTLKSGQPFFRFDFELINNDKNAKRPTFWVHNASIDGLDGSDTVIRPSERGLDALGGNRERFPAPEAGDYVRDFNHGWTARVNEKRKEGIVYLMDYDCTQTLYNCGNTTEEWFYDGILVFKDRPWKGRVYILPIIGLGRVDYANEYFICAVESKRQDGKLAIDYLLTSSYEKAARVTLNTEVEHNLLGGEVKTTKLPPVTVDGLNIQPVRGHVEGPLAEADPLCLNVTAFVELPDGTTKTHKFQSLHIGDYRLGKNARDDGAPVKRLARLVRNPEVPPVPAELAINRKEFNVFGVMGMGSLWRLELDKAVSTIPDAKLDIGHCIGSDPKASGLTDFPYDYDRLYNYRVMLVGNAQDQEFRRIGASILLPWLKAGGGLVVTGGEFVFNTELEQHPINDYHPIQPRERSIRKGPLQLRPPEVKDHPIFKGIDLSELPWMYYYHDIALKTGSDARVLMKVGDLPFIVEKKTGNQITIVIAVNGLGEERYFPGKNHVRQWSQWPKLYGNCVRYAGGEQ